jgi:fructokinase
MLEKDFYKTVASLKGEFDILCISPANSHANIVFPFYNLGKKPLLITKLRNGAEDEAFLAALNKYECVNERVLVGDKNKAIIRRTPERPEFKLVRGVDVYFNSEDIDLSLVKKSKIIHANAVLLAEEPTRSTVLGAIKEAKQSNKLVSFDLNYAINVQPEKSKALQLFTEVCGFVDLVKLSLDDAKELFGELKPLEYIKRVHAFGARLVVLTMGKEGSLISTENKIIKILPEQCTGTNTKGAGDIYWAVFLIALLGGDKFEKAGRKASYAAAKFIRRKKSVLEKEEYDDIYAYMRML